MLSPPAGKPPALDVEVLCQLEEILVALEAEAPSLLVIRSNAEKYFCVGADIRVLERTSPETIDSWIACGHRVLDRLDRMPCVTLARVEGYALGGGLEVALACDYLYASDTARLGLPETRLGFVPGWGGAGRLAERVGRVRAKQLIFEARIVTAEEGLAMGLVDALLPADKMDAAIQTLQGNLAAGCPSARADVKSLLSADRAGILSFEQVLSRACVSRPSTQTRIQTFLQRKK
jgi:enoyl-CoA hydratase